MTPDAGPVIDYSGTYSAKMTADQSVPPTTSTGTGNLQVVATNQMDGGYAVTVTGTLTGFVADTASAVHIHNSHAGRNGPILNGNLYMTTNDAGSVVVSGVQPLTQASLQEIAAGRAYLNVHTVAFGSGAVRGQVLSVGDVLWSAQLSGANSVPVSTAGAVGGVGFIVSLDGGVSYEGSWDPAVVATASHIHDGGVGVNGPLLVPLTLVGTTGIKGLFGADLVGPGTDQYVNVHTTDAGNGLIRGQIVRH
jgi:hypothetical protein